MLQVISCHLTQKTCFNYIISSYVLSNNVNNIYKSNFKKEPNNCFLCRKKDQY